jgi:hypothetical protein
VPGTDRRSGAVKVSGGRYAVVIARPNGIISLNYTPPANPQPRAKRRVVAECPCCAQLFEFAEFVDGTVTLEPFSDDGNCPF